MEEQTQGYWIEKEGLYEYSIKRLPREMREAALQRLSERFNGNDSVSEFLKTGRFPPIHSCPACKP